MDFCAFPKQSDIMIGELQMELLLAVRYSVWIIARTQFMNSQPKRPCYIYSEMYQNGELGEMIEKARADMI
jgi:hypothetical protein